MKASIIVPAYNEDKAIERTINVLSGYLDSVFDDFELIVVSDGSRDRTFAKASRLNLPQLKVFEYHPNRGKGHALKYGFEKSSGDLIAFFDAGLDFPPEHIKYFVELLKKNSADVVIGSKRHPRSKVNYPFKRKIISLMAQACTHLLFSLNVTDTQVGLKIFRRKVLVEVMPLMLVKRFAFDIELLALAQRRGFKIVEAPVELNLNFSTAGTMRAVWKTFLDTLGIFYRLKIMGFYDKSVEERERILRERRDTLIDRIFSPLYPAPSRE